MIKNDFTPVYYRHNVNNNCFSISARKNTFDDLTFVLDGKLDYIINGKKISVTSGNILYVPTGAICERLSSDNLVDYVSINYAKSEEKFFDAGVISTTINPKIKNIISVIDYFLEQNTENTKSIQKLLQCSIFYMVYDLLNYKKENSTIMEIKSYIKDNISNKITLKDIGEKMFFSPVYCDTLFKKETGLSVISYAINEKLNYAKSLIIEGVPLKNVASAVGFSDYNYFSRLFKNKTGETPMTYKQKYFK